MSISHLEVRRHPLWREEAALGARQRKSPKSDRTGLVLLAVGAMLVAGAIYLLTILRTP